MNKIFDPYSFILDCSFIREFRVHTLQLHDKRLSKVIGYHQGRFTYKAECEISWGVFTSEDSSRGVRIVLLVCKCNDNRFDVTQRSLLQLMVSVSVKL